MGCVIKENASVQPHSNDSSWRGTRHRAGDFHASVALVRCLWAEIARRNSEAERSRVTRHNIGDKGWIRWIYPRVDRCAKSVHNKADIVNTGDNNAPPPVRMSHERNAAMEGESQLKYSSVKEGREEGRKGEVRGSAQSKTESSAVGGYETRNPERKRRRRRVVTTVTTVR